MEKYRLKSHNSDLRKDILLRHCSEVIRKWCAKNGFNKAVQAASFCGIDQVTFNNYYRGKRVPTLELLEVICRKLGGNPSEIFPHLREESDKTRKWMNLLKSRFISSTKERKGIEMMVMGLWKEDDLAQEIINWLKEE